MRSLLMSPVVKMASLIICLPETLAQQEPQCEGPGSNWLGLTAFGITIVGIMITLTAATHTGYHFYVRRRLNISSLGYTVLGGTLTVAGFTLGEAVVSHPSLPRCFS